MKTKTNKKHLMISMIGMIALLATMVVLLLAATPAMAKPVHLTKDVIVNGAHRMAFDADVLRHVLDAMESLEDDSDGPFPDGGGWETVWPDGVNPEDIIPDDMIPDDVIPGDDGEDGPEEGDEADDADEADEGEEADDGEEADEPGDDCEDVTEEEGDEADEGEEEEPSDEVTEEEGDEEDESDEPTLPFTGGNSTPWLIAGAAVILAGVLMVTRRRNGNSER